MSTSGTGQTVIVSRTGGPGCLVQALWFIFVGWWLGAIAIALAWISNVTLIGLPLGMTLLNNIPRLLALQDPSRQIRAVSADGATVLSESGPPQINIILRAAYFVLIGWWWSGIWLSIAYVLAATIVLLPVSLPMFRLTPLMTTLRRY